MEKKVCTKCGEEKELNQYSKQKNCIMGVRPNCKECKKKDDREYRLKNRKEILKNRKEKQELVTKNIKDKKEKELKILIDEYTNLNLGGSIVLTNYLGYFCKFKKDQYPRHYFEKKCLLCEKTSSLTVGQINNYIKNGVDCTYCKGSLRFNQNKEIEKKCNSCQEWKTPTEENFVKSKNRRFGIHYYCKDCHREKNIKRRESYEVRKKEYHNSYEKRKNNPIIKLKNNISSLIRMSIKGRGYKKNTRTCKILGCSIEEFKIHIESQWEEWMTWDNYGKYNGGKNYGWDFDHKIPISLAKTEKDVIELNHYNNFQPLCSYINRYVKKDKIEDGL